MTNWFDLPQEVKQTIFGYVSATDAIVYVPKDRRMKVDKRYFKHQHFHNILLVSKQFITPEDFAFALLGTAKLTFDSYNDFKRLSKEVSPAFKQCVNRMHFRRSLYRGNRIRESFDGFSNLEETLSSNFHGLKQIFVTLPEYCANIGHYSCHSYTGRDDPIPSEKANQMMLYTLAAGSENTNEQKEILDSLEKYQNYTPRHNALPRVVASFLGNRDTNTKVFAWTRPHAWLARLIRFAEANQLEVIVELNLCLTNRIRTKVALPELGSQSDSCWSNRYYTPCYYTGDWRDRCKIIHTPATMSTKDWTLRVMHDGVEYKYYQGLAFEMVHAPPHSGASFWAQLLKDFALETVRSPDRFHGF